MNKIPFLLVAYAYALLLPAFAYTAPEATLVVEVIDDNGVPVAGADAKLGFETSTGQDEIVLGKTDDKGRFTASGHTTGMVFYSARKIGYYDNTDLRYRFREREGEKWASVDHVCQLVLKRIVEPVPMYVRQLTITLPVLDNPVGFDFQIGDWVAPHGNGISTDILIKATRRFTSLDDFDAEIVITFPNRFDGMEPFLASQRAGSVLASPQAAPNAGYASSWRRKISRRPGEERTDTAVEEDMNYIFRVRCVEDEKGNLIYANYGKIYGEIGFGGFAQEKPSMAFWYYFNPKVNSRSLEFDTKENLAGERMPKP